MPRRHAWLVAALLTSAVVLATAPASPAANVVPNSSFENDCAGVPCGWTDVSGSGTMGWDGSTAHTGSASAIVTSNGLLPGSSSAAASACFPVTAGFEYERSFWYRTTSPDVTKVIQNLKFYATADCSQGAPSPVNVYTTAPVADGAWHEVSTDGVVFANVQAAMVTVFFYCSTCNGTAVNFDDVVVDAEPPPGPPPTPPANAPLDQELQLDPVSGWSLAVGGNSDQKLAQVVTAGRAGFLREVRLPLSCVRSSQVQFEVRPVLGADAQGPSFGDPLASATVPGSSLRRPLFGAPVFQALPIGPSLFMPVGERFGIAVAADAVGCTLEGVPLGDPYGDGEGYFDAAPNQRGVWVPLVNPSVADSPHDLPFETFVESACLVPPVRGLALAAARARIRRYGCVPGKAKYARSRSRRGTVISTTPKAGTQLGAGAAVRMTVSAGPKARRRHPHR